MVEYQCLNTVPNSWLRVLTRVCSSQWTPSRDHALSKGSAQCKRLFLPLPSAAAGGILQSKLPTGPASPPVPYGIVMEVHYYGCTDIGQEQIGMEEQHQHGALSRLIHDCPLLHDTPRFTVAPSARTLSQGHQHTEHSRGQP